MMEPAYTYAATVTHWVDGDTVDLAVDLGFHLTANDRFRLYGINTPERGQAGYAEATARCRELAPEGAAVVVKTYKAQEKYGRFLALIEANGVEINSTLVNEGLAVPYFGGTK